MNKIKKFLVLIFIIIPLLIIALIFLYRNYINQQPVTPKIIYKPEDTIKILEGWNSREIDQYFSNQGRYKNEEFLSAVGFPRLDYRENKDKPALKDWSEQFSFLSDKPKYYGLEGYLFPDTYRIYSTSSVEEVIVKLLDNFDNKLTPEMRAEIKVQGKTIYEVITMASIIEKEAPFNYQTNDDADARLISGIFWRRLKAGQALQSDATLSYIFGDKNPQHSGKELEIDSPYNTYKYRDLPPGPICNPGLWAIKAAIYPTVSSYNYFLTSLDGQKVYYARSYDEHLRNKYKYLK